MSAAKKGESGSTGKKGDRKKENAADTAGPEENVYEIPVEEGASLESAIEELEKHVDAVEKRQQKGKRGKKNEPERDTGLIEISFEEHEQLKEKISELSDEANDFKDKWLRSVAEFENYRKRSRKEWELLKLQSKADVVLEILNVVDDFERAFSAADDRDDEFVQGIRLIYNNLKQVLDKFDVHPIDALHTRFDPNFHMAIGQIESDEAESGLVVEETQKGYLMGDTVLRPAKVIIAK